MKRISIFLKSIILSVVSLCMVFGIVFNGNAESYRVNASSSSKVYSTNYYTLSYENNEVKLLLNSDLSVYDNFSRSDVVALKDAIVSVGYSAIFDDVDFAKMTSSLSSGSSTGTGLSIDVSNVEQIIINQLVDYESIDNALAEDGTYDILLEYYVDRYTDVYVANNPTSTVEEVLASIETQLTTTIQDVVNNVYSEQLEYAPNVSDKISTIVSDVKENKETGNEISLSLSNVSEIINLVNDKDVVVDIVKELDVTEEIKDVVVNSSVEETVDFLKTADMDTVINVFENVEIEKEDVKTIISNVGIDNLIDIVDTVGADKIADLAQSVNLNKNDFNEIIQESKDDLSIQSLLKAVKAVRIDGIALYENTEIKMGGFESLLKSLPKPAEIAKYTDDQMKFTWNLEVETVFGSVEFDFTVGFEGDCSMIRTAAQTIADSVDVSVQNGVYSVELYAPERLDNLLLRVSNSGAISDDIKLALFNLTSSTVDEVYGNITDKTLDEYLEILKEIDYQVIVANLYNAENLNSVFGTNKFTDARLDAFVDEVCGLVSKASNLSYDRIKNFVSKYVDISRLDNTQVETLITKATNVLKKIDALSLDSALLREFIDPNSQYTNENIYNYIDKLANYEGYFNRAMDYFTRAYEAAPDRFKDNSILDFYKGNGEFNYTGSFTLDYEKVLTKVSSKYGPMVYDAMVALFDKLPTSIDVSLTANINDVHQVTYYIGEEVKTGLLPVGADVAFFANRTELNGNTIDAWVDVNGVEYTTMPAQDIELYAFVDFEVSISDGISKVYDGDSYTLSVTTDVENAYTYQWYKDGTAIDGAISSTYDVVNVLDSGSYYCEVTLATLTKQSETVEVEITPIVFDVSTLTWDYEEPFTWDGTSWFTVKLVDVPEFIKIDYTRNRGWAAYNYTATAVARPINENYSVIGEIAPLDWVVLPKIVNVNNLQWAYTDPFTYDGTPKAVALKSVPAGVKVVYSGTTATEAGTYTAVAKTVPTSNNYYLRGNVKSLTWTILPAENDNSGLSWNYTSAFVYDGTEKSVALTNVPEGVKVTYSGNTATEAGTYTATATFESTDPNYELTVESVELEWTINPATIDLSDVAWDYTNAFVYDGTEKTVSLVNIPENVTVTYFGNKATEVGTYLASATVTPVNANYVVNGTIDNIGWEITRGVINNDSLVWDYVSAFTYDGTEKTVTITNLPEGVQVTYLGNKATDAGKYTATATLTSTNVNYELTVTSVEIAWEINPAQIDVSGLEWNYTEPFKYDGNEKVVALKDVPANVTITYSGDYKAVSVGKYNALAIATPTSTNYEVVGEIAQLAWEIEAVDTPIPPIDDPELKTELTLEIDGVIVVIVKANPGITADSIHYEVVTEALKDIDLSSLCGEKEKAELLAAYNIALKDLAGTIKTYESNFVVSIYIPTEFRNIENLKLVHIAEDGTITDMNGVVDGEYIVFNTTHFSNYAFVEIEQVSNWWIWLLVALAVIIIVVVIIIILRRNKKVAPITVEASETPSYLVVTENGVEEVALAEAQENDILSSTETNEFAIGKVENGKIYIFKDGLPVKISCGKVVEQEDGSTVVNVYKKPIKVVCQFEKIVVEHTAETNELDVDTQTNTKLEIGLIEERNNKVVVKIYKTPKVVK